MCAFTKVSPSRAALRTHAGAHTGFEGAGASALPLSIDLQVMLISVAMVSHEPPQSLRYAAGPGSDQAHGVADGGRGRTSPRQYRSRNSSTERLRAASARTGCRAALASPLRKAFTVNRIVFQFGAEELHSTAVVMPAISVTGYWIASVASGSSRPSAQGYRRRPPRRKSVTAVMVTDLGRRRRQ